MRKLISAAFLGLAFSASAQISLAAKANVAVPTSSASWKNFKTAANNIIEQKGKNITGFNLGLSLKIDLPTSLYLMPEIYYTNFSNEVTVLNDANANQTTIKAKNSRLDIPVLLGAKFLGNLLSGYVGPVGSFNLAKSDNYDNFIQKVEAKAFTVGYQLGVQSEIKKVVLSARYEGAFSKDQRKFINNIAGSDQEINYDNRPSLFLFGLGYKF